MPFLLFPVPLAVFRLFWRLFWRLFFLAILRLFLDSIYAVYLLLSLVAVSLYPAYSHIKPSLHEFEL